MGIAVNRIGRAAWIGAMALVAAVAASGEERISELLSRGNAGGDATEVAPGIFLAYANSNVYRVVTPEGDVVIDAGLVMQAPEQKRQLDAVSEGPVRKLVLTHSHGDHVGGTGLWQAEGAEVVAQRHFRWRNLDQVRLTPFRGRRSSILWAGMTPEGTPPYEAIDVDVVVDAAHSFELGGLTFELLWTPGGEGPDALSVFIPEKNAIFTGDLLGPSEATFPNLFTLRGENLREPVPMIESIDRVLALEPELLLPGHFEPVRGREEIRDLLTKTRDAVAYVHDATVAGMNQGTPLLELMRTVELPPELAVSQQYGRVPWGVRAIWEGYTGWFRYESTTELYEVPAASVHPELVEMAGGPEAVAKRALARVEAGEPLEALHLVDIAAAAAPNDRAVLEARLAALGAMAEVVGQRNFQEAGWLRHRIGETRAQLAALE